MAAPRESSFMPTIKCSQCNKDVEISMMGDHQCGPAAQSAEPAPLATGGDYLGGAFASITKTVFGFGSRAPPPTVDTTAANQAFAKQDQLTPVSASTGSRTISPKTPTGRSSTGSNGNDYFTPAIASDSPSRGRRSGGYGGFGDAQPYEAEPMYSSSPNKQPPSLLQRMNSIAPGPFEMNRRPGAKNAFAPRNNRMDAAEDDLSYPSGNSNGGMAPPRAPRKNGYGGFGAPGRDTEEEEPERGGYEPRPLGSNQRSDTFPKENKNDYDSRPTRTPSAPGSRPDWSRRSANDYQEQPQPTMTRDRQERPSFGMRDTSRPPPPRGSFGRSGREGSGSVNLADEFGANNPYHSPSVSQSSSNSGYSDMSRPSQPSSNTSPARSMSSRRQASDATNIDALMEDLQSSMADITPKDLPYSPPQPPPIEKDIPVRPNNFRAPPEDYRSEPAVRGNRDSNDSRYERAAQEPTRRRPPPPDILRYNRSASRDRGPPRQRSPLAAPDGFNSFPGRNEPPVQNQRDQWDQRDERDRRPSQDTYSSGRGGAAPPRTHSRQPSMGRPRGNCKGCGELITGKSISSADGRLTGRYHKACFVCTTCQEPFSSSTFYVLDDKPYCERHYHRLNGSLCGTCGNGIEGQYLEDEKLQKYHPGCFQCGDCGQVLREGYFEVNGKAYCERDAWKRVVQPAPSVRGPGGLKPPMGGRQPGGYRGDGRLAPPGLRPRMEKRMTRLGMM